MPKGKSGEFVAIEGLDQFRKALKELGPEWPKALGKANKDAAELVADEARQRATLLEGVHRHVAPSIKAAAVARQAQVSVGGSRWPMALGAEFGSLQFSQFPPWRGNQWQPDSGNVGYFLHPAIRDKADEFTEVYGRAVDRLAAEAFPD